MFPIRLHASVVALHSVVVVEVLDILYRWCLPALCYNVCIAACPLSLAITLNVNIPCIGELRTDQLVLGPQLMFVTLLCYSFPFPFVQIHHRPFCFGRNLQFHIGLWDESCKASRLDNVIFAFPLYCSFPYCIVEIHHRPLYRSVNLQFSTRLLDMKIKSSRLNEWLSWFCCSVI